MLLLIPAIAHAADPLEGGLDPARPELVDRAWLAMERCAGVAPPDLEGVVFHEVADLGRYGGMTTTAADRRAHVVVRTGPEVDPVAVLLHELAHHWVSWEPRLLEEGFTELLAECAARELSLPTDAHPEVPVNGEPVADWRTDDGLDDAALARRYAVAIALARALEPLLTPEERWNPRVHRSWADLWDLVAADVTRTASGGEPGALTFRTDPRLQEVLPLLMADLAVGDLDDDGLAGFVELASGTDPLRWDTDADGWWDGAAPPPGAIAHPRAETCVGVATTSGPLTLTASTPEAGVYWTSTIAVAPGHEVRVPGSGVRARAWIEVAGATLAPCAPAEPVAGAWPAAAIDADGDGLADEEERARGTDPARWDTDGDGWWDGAAPPSGAHPATGTGWTCVGTRRLAWGLEVTVGGPDARAVRARPTRDRLGRRELVGLHTLAPAGSRAWVELRSPPLRPCPRLVPLHAGTVCVGVAREDGPIVAVAAGPDAGMVTVERRVDGAPREEAAPLRAGERLELAVEAAPEFTGRAWVTLDPRLAPCDEPSR